MSASNASETTIEDMIGSKTKQRGESMLQWKMKLKYCQMHAF